MRERLETEKFYRIEFFNFYQKDAEHYDTHDEGDAWDLYIHVINRRTYRKVFLLEMQIIDGNEVIMKIHEASISDGNISKIYNSYLEENKEDEQF